MRAVLAREFVPFLLRTIMNPLLFTFVFTYVFPKIGAQITPGGGNHVSFATVIVPGLVAVAIFFQGIAAVALPLATELGGTREIEDRVMAPLPVSMVALEKVDLEQPPVDHRRRGGAADGAARVGRAGVGVGGQLADADRNRAAGRPSSRAISA